MEYNNNKYNDNKNKNNYIQNNDNINYEGDKKKFSSVKINKHSLTYFCFLITNYMKKASYLMCVYEIANFQKTYEKNLGLKLLFMIMKKRIIFYKIKFFHRFKKIYKYLIKYKKSNSSHINNNNIQHNSLGNVYVSNNNNTNNININRNYVQNKVQYNRKGYKK